MSEDRMIANRFKIEALLGQGGMGTVYRGVDTQSGQTVAIKSLKAEIIAEDPSILQRFEREGEALRLLNHPNIVKMLATAEEDGKHYLVMEYVSGGSLLDLLNQQEQLPVQRVLEIGLDLADALTRAHRLKIIHRDLKPANVMLSEDGTPKLTDFGVAQMGNFTRMTQTGAFVGTYAYLSPEVLSGEPLDARTDIWAFGIMLYEMLTGHRPFEADQTAALLTAILTKPVPPMSQFRSDVPIELEDLIQRMLEKEREIRINSIRLVGAEIEALLSGDTSQLHAARAISSETGALRGSLASERFATPTPSASASMRPFESDPATVTPTSGAVMGVPIPDGTIIPKTRANRKFNPLFIIIGIVGIVVLGIAAAFLLSSSNAACDADIQAVAAGEYMVLVAPINRTSGDERDVTGAIVDNLTRVLEVEVPFSNIRVRTYGCNVRSDDEARTAATNVNAAVVVWGNYDAQGVTLNVQVGATAPFPYIEFDRALLERTGNISVQMTNERQQSVAPQVVTVVALLHNADGNVYQLLRAMAILSALAVNPVEMTSSNVASHTHVALLAYIDEPERALAEANAGLEQDASNPILYTTRALYYMRQGSLTEVIDDVRTMERLAPDSWVLPLYMRGGVAELEGDWAQALEIYSQIVELRPHEWFPLNYRAAIRYVMGDYEGSRADYDRVFEFNPDAGFPYITSTVLAMREGRINDARSYINIILTRFQDPTLANRVATAAFGERGSIFGIIFSGFGNFLIGLYEEAIQDMQAASVIEPSLADPYLLEGLSYCNLEQYEEAETAYSRAIELDPNFTLLYGLRAQVRQNLGDMIGALSDLQVVQDANLGEEFEELAAQSLAGDVDCRNFFDS